MKRITGDNFVEKKLSILKYFFRFLNRDKTFFIFCLLMISLREINLANIYFFFDTLFFIIGFDITLFKNKLKNKEDLKFSLLEGILYVIFLDLECVFVRLTNTIFSFFISLIAVLVNVKSKLKIKSISFKKTKSVS